MAYRINGFEQIKSFYSIVFEQKHEIKPQHISLYIFLIHQNNRNNWVEWFKCPFDLAMTGACLSNKATYYKCLADLQDWKLIKYEKGQNAWKAPKIKIEVLKHTSTVPQSEQVEQQVPEPLLQQVPEPLLQPSIYNLKPITLNIKLITEVCNYFSISEMSFPKSYFLICEFIECLTFNNRIEHFEKQFEAYKKLTTDPKYKFNLEKYLGSGVEKYEDGKWNAENYTDKLAPKNEKPKLYVKPENYEFYENYLKRIEDYNGMPPVPESEHKRIWDEKRKFEADLKARKLADGIR